MSDLERAQMLIGAALSLGVAIWAMRVKFSFASFLMAWLFGSAAAICLIFGIVA